MYGAEPGSLAQAPGGRDNARVVSRATFAALSLPDADGNYFLRPDRILGMFVLNPSNPQKGYHFFGAVSLERTTSAGTTEVVVTVSRVPR